jgi:hypothetical protein
VCVCVCVCVCQVALLREQSICYPIGAVLGGLAAMANQYIRDSQSDYRYVVPMREWISGWEGAGQTKPEKVSQSPEMKEKSQGKCRFQMHSTFLSLP